MNVIYYEEENLYPTLAYVNVYSVGTNDPWTVNDDVADLLIQFKDRWQNTPAVPGGGVPGWSRYLWSEANALWKAPRRRHRRCHRRYLH